MIPPLSPLFIAMYVIGGISVISSLFVIITIKRYGSNSISSRLVLYLHFTLLLEDVSIFPYIYNGNTAICQIMGFVRVYSGLSNIIVVGCMVQVYRNLFIEDNYNTSDLINKYAEYACFVFPLITVLPFSMQMYQSVDGAWCAEPIYSWEQILWFWMVSLLWTFLVIIYAVYTLAYTFYTVYRVDKELGNKLVKTIGMYALVSLVVWNFLVASSFEVLSHTFANLSIYVCGILYLVIFLTEKKSLKLLEQFMASNTVNLDDETVNGQSSDSRHTPLADCFSWELDDELLSVRRSMASRNSANTINSSNNGRGSRFSDRLFNTNRQSSLAMELRSSTVSINTVNTTNTTKSTNTNNASNTNAHNPIHIGETGAVA